MCIADSRTDRDDERAKLIASRFGSAAKRYDQFAIVQRQAADTLSQWIGEAGGMPTTADPNSSTSSIDGSFQVLEVGCGTGFLTERLLNFSKAVNWTITDVSREMLQACRNKVDPLIAGRDDYQIDFSELDVNSFSKRNQFDLIVSSFTLQWLPDIDAWLPSLVDGLRIGGKLYFNLLTDDSFAYWNRNYAVAAEKREPFPTPPSLPSSAALISALEAVTGSRGNGIHFETRNNSIHQTYGGFLEFLASLKSIGANSLIGEDGLSFADLKRWRAKFQDEPVEMNYEIVETRVEIKS